MKTRIPLPQAALANKIIDALTPGGDKVAIAGSIRRQVAAVADIEIVATPWLAETEASMYDE